MLTTPMLTHSMTQAPRFGAVTVNYVPTGDEAGGKLGTTPDGALAFTDQGLDEYVSVVIPAFQQDPGTSASFDVASGETAVRVSKNADRQEAVIESGSGTECAIAEHLMRMGGIFKRFASGTFDE